MQNNFYISDDLTLIDCKIDNPILTIPSNVKTLGTGLFSIQHIKSRFIQSVPNINRDTLLEIFAKEYSQKLPLQRQFARVKIAQLMQRFNVKYEECLGIVSDLPQLQTLYLSKTLTCIEQDCFLNVPNLRNIYYTGTEEEWKHINFHNNNMLKYTVHFKTLPPIKDKSSATSIIQNYLYIDRFEKGVKYTLPDGIKQIQLNPFISSIPDNAFLNSNANYIKFGKAIESLGAFSFAFSSIKCFSSPNSITTIPQGCFKECNELTYVKLSDKCESIERDAFKNCTSLSCIILPKTLKYIGKDVFIGCPSDMNILYGGKPDDIIKIDIVDESFNKRKWTCT